MIQKNKQISHKFFAEKFKKSLTGKMIFLLGKCVVIAIFLFVILYMGSKVLLDVYFENSNYLKRVEGKRIEELQQYILVNKIATTDTELLTKWVKEHNIPLVTISRKRELLYDSTYMARTPIGETDAEYLHESWQYFYTVEFEDGDADVLIYEGFEEKYYLLALMLSILSSIVLMLFLFVKELQKEVSYIKELKEEIEMIGGGCLTHSIEIQGEDELAGLAAGLNQMRLSLLQTQKMEEKMRIAEEELVTGMSHDLRTPLTGLMTYLEIMRIQDEHGDKIERKYLEKSFDKALQMRTLSDQMFEYFLAKREQDVLLNPPMDWYSAIGDYLSEFVYLMQKVGFDVKYQQPDKKPVRISVNEDFLGRIFDNIISNLEKYADQTMPVNVDVLLEKKQIGFKIKNTIVHDNIQKKSNGIGMKNVGIMMQKMNGHCEIQIVDNQYILILWLPVCDAIKE